ncbi:MAG: response regulator [Paenibacillaceae bacterium]|nr:response regulator [Paenibacillaceae bacterium]
MKILIADDELHIRQGLEHLDWASIGVKVCGSAQNGQEAIELAMLLKPDIILSDIKMPYMDGLEMTELFLHLNPQCAVIFLSGYREFAFAKKALMLGAFDYLLKPTDPAEILACCKRAAEEITASNLQTASIVEMKCKIKELEIKNEIEREKPVYNDSKIKLSRILEFIDKHYCTELSLQDLSVEFHFNPIYINRIIKKETGYTFLEILNNKRMSKASEYLKRPDINISEVASLIGIPDQRYFSQVFKKYYGQSPREYRKLLVKKWKNI